MKFGTDGDGNCGYYGADGSLIPFKSGCNIELYHKYESSISKKYTFNEDGTYIIETFWNLTIKTDDIIKIFEKNVSINGSSYNHNLYYVKNAVPDVTSFNVGSGNNVCQYWIIKIT